MIHKSHRIWEKKVAALSRRSTGTKSTASTPLQPSTFSLQLSQKASALITTLLVLVVLSTICVAFMQSMSVERSVAKSTANRYQSELAVRAGVEMARATLLNAITNPIAGGVAYTTWGYYPSTNDVYFSAITVGRPNLLNDTNFLSTNNTTWLFSSPRNVSTTNVANPDQVATLPPGDRVNLNSKGNIAPDRRVISVPWHEISRTTNNGQVYISRVAYWADDEGSRLNLLAQQLGTATNFQGVRKDGAHPSEMLFDQIVTRTNLQQITSQPISQLTRKSILQNLQTNAIATLETNSFLYTTRSLTDNRIQYGPTNSGLYRRGMKRMNLNWADLTNSSIAVTNRVSELVDAMEQGCQEFLSTTNVLYFPSVAANFQPPSVTPSASLGIPRALKSTIAASIIDYLDSDFIPTQPSTILSATNTNSPAPPVRMLNDMPRPAFFGAESAPVINEVQIVWNARPGQTTANTTVTRTGNASTGFTYTVPILWQFELWNMSDQAL
ncbi:MAG: hypothetical protein ACOYNN_06835, partial [Terrimicrobiaceae bacterium]